MVLDFPGAEALGMRDIAIGRIIEEETRRQDEGIELIASENYPSRSVREAQGSILTAKYAEGYPGRRYYGGCAYVDEAEGLAMERAKELFHVPYANVQPHSGSQANFACYRALLKGRGRAKILALELNDGGHLTHGSPVSFSSDLYDVVFYPLGEDGRLDYGVIEKRMEEEMPDLLLAGYSAYPYEISFSTLRDIVDRHNGRHGTSVRFMVDMAHIAGIVAAGLCENPCLYADAVTSTTHKTLRGPRGGLILSRDLELGKAFSSAVFPYSQGGPLEHVIAGKAVAFGEALHPDFQVYMKAVLRNTKAAAEEFRRLGVRSSGTETHLFLLDVLDSYGMTGREAQMRLESVGITTNKNMIHGDRMKPKDASGIRIGFAAATSRGAKEEDAVRIARLIHGILEGKATEEEARGEVKSILRPWANIEDLEYPTIAS